MGGFCVIVGVLLFERTEVVCNLNEKSKLSCRSWYYLCTVKSFKGGGHLVFFVICPDRFFGDASKPCPQGPFRSSRTLHVLPILACSAIMLLLFCHAGAQRIDLVVWLYSPISYHVIPFSLLQPLLDFLPVLTLAGWVLPLTLGHLVHFAINTWNLLAFSIFLENSSLFFRT